MTISRRTLLGTATAAAAVPLVRPRAQGAPTIKIGVLNDMSGPYMDDQRSDVRRVLQAGAGGFRRRRQGAERRSDQRRSPEQAGPGGVHRAPMVRPRRRGHDPRRADLVRGARRVGRGAREEQGLHLLRRGATSDLTGKVCSPNIVHWTYDTYMLAKSTGGAMVKAGGDSWYFLTADYAFGKQLQADTTSFIAGRGRQGRSAHRSIRSRAPRISRPSWCRRSRAARRCWACAMPARIPSTPSSRPTSSA